MTTLTISPDQDSAELSRFVAGIPLAEIDVSRPSLFQSDKIGTFFERLRREVAKLKAERDILKKAAAYFAKEAI